MKNHCLKKLSGLFVVIFVTGVLTMVAYLGPVRVQAAAPPVLNGYELNANQSKWIQYIAENVVPLLPGNPDQKAAMAANGTWWSLRESVLDENNPIGYSNCAQRPDPALYKGNEHIGFIELCKESTPAKYIAWQVGLAAVQVPNPPDSEVIAKAQELNHTSNLKDILSRVSTLSGYPQGTPEYDTAVNSTGYLQKSLLLRDPATGFYFVDREVIKECLVPNPKDWCGGNSFSRTRGEIDSIIADLTVYFKNSLSGSSGAISPTTPTTGEQKEIPLGLSQQIGKFYAFALGVGGLVALGVLVFGGILYTVSAGNASREDDAKQWITGSIVGLILLFGSWFILNRINPELTKLTDLKLLANKAAEGLPGDQGIPAEPGTVVIEGKACPMKGGYKPLSDSCGAPRPQGGTGPSGHQGMDIMAPLGTPLYAIENGVIDGGHGWSYFGGWRFWLYADSGNKYYYAHTLSEGKLPPLGKHVRAGELIGYVGNSGQGPEGTTGQFAPHLHLGFIAKEGGPTCGDLPYTNPYNLIKAVCDAGSVAPLESSGLAQVLNKSPYSQFGVVFAELGGQSASGGADKTFKIASLYKLFVAQYLYEQREKGLSFNQKIVQLIDVAGQLAENGRDSNPSSVWPTTPKEGQYISIQDCMSKMITWSDNVCGTALLKFVQNKGYAAPGGSSELAANDIAKVLTDIAQGKMASPLASQELYNLLLEQHHINKIPKGVPSGAVVANKTGELHGSNYSNDAAIIKYNGKTYILVVLTHLDPDTPSTDQTIQQLTRELFSALK